MTEHALRVLLIEDEARDVMLLRRALSKAQTRFEIGVASDLTDGIEAATHGTWDVVLCDLSLPDGHELDAVRRLRECVPGLPIVVLTGLASDETGLASLDIGAQDYLVKDRLTPETLERSIRYAVHAHKSMAMRKLLDELQANERSMAKKNRRLARLYKTAHRFVDNVSHEFRTPLTVVNEYVSLLRDGVVGPVNDEQKQMLDVIGDRAEDLNNMVDDMLDVSRLEAGMLGLWRRKCGIAKIVDYVRPSMARKAHVKQVELQFDIPDDLPDVFCDDEKIGRVIINLAVNAIKFCGRPGRVQIWAEYKESEGAVVVGVTDNGEGVSPENLAVIFQRFKQIGQNPRGSTKGFGLGLNIAKELVHLNLGAIDVKSSVGKGSTFWFNLPIADVKEVMSRYVKRINQVKNAGAAVSLLTVTTAQPVHVSLSEDVNTFLNTLLRRHDLIFRTDENFWLLAVTCERFELESLVARAEETRQKINRNRPGEPLPSIVIKPLGTWLVADDSAGFLDAVARCVAAPIVSTVS
jgi:signal transduction histidine kinase